MEEKFTITCTLEQLQLIANAVEDWCRFLAGQCDMSHAVDMLYQTGSVTEIRDILKQLPRIVASDLPPGSSYSWSGHNCQNEPQKKAIAMSYGIYRQIEHFLALRRKSAGYAGYDIYTNPTLTCPEQGGLIEVKEDKETEEQK